MICVYICTISFCCMSMDGSWSSVCNCTYMLHTHWLIANQYSHARRNTLTHIYTHDGYRIRTPILSLISNNYHLTGNHASSFEIRCACMLLACVCLKQFSHGINGVFSVSNGQLYVKLCDALSYTHFFMKFNFFYFWPKSMECVWMHVSCHSQESRKVVKKWHRQQVFFFLSFWFH